MSKDTDKQSGGPGTGQRSRRRRKKSGIRIPSDNVPRRYPRAGTDDDVSRPITEDAVVAASVAADFGAEDSYPYGEYGGEYGDDYSDQYPLDELTEPESDEEWPREDTDGADGRERASTHEGASTHERASTHEHEHDLERARTIQMPAVEIDDEDTRKTREMPAFRLEDLPGMRSGAAVSGARDARDAHDASDARDARDDDDVDVEIDVEAAAEEVEDNDSVPVPVDDSVDIPLDSVDIPLDSVEAAIEQGVAESQPITPIAPTAPTAPTAMPAPLPAPTPLPKPAGKRSPLPPPRAATVALSEDDLEEILEPESRSGPLISGGHRAESSRGDGAGSARAPSIPSLPPLEPRVITDVRSTQPLPINRPDRRPDRLTPPPIEDEPRHGAPMGKRDAATGVISGVTGDDEPSAESPEPPAPDDPDLPAAVAALESAGRKSETTAGASAQDTSVESVVRGDSGEIIDEEMLEEVDAGKPLPPAPPPTPSVAPKAMKPPPAPKPADPRQRKGKPWFEEIFDEDYLRTLPFLTPQATQAEASFVAEALDVPQGGQILDVGCGYGRHAMELAARGYHIVALDASLPLLLRGADEAQRRGLNINFVHGDMRDMTFDAQFDGAYCLFSTFGYFDDETNKKAAQGIGRALKPGARLVIQVLNRDYLIADLPCRVWWEGDGCVVLEEVEFNYFASRIVSNRSVVFDDGRQLEQEISMRAYSLHEFGKLLHAAGFRVLEISGGMVTKGRFFGNHSREIIVVAERRMPKDASIETTAERLKSS